MESSEAFDYERSIREWERTVPWYRRLSARIGLQGKLLLCFMGLLAAALGGSSFLFMTKSNERLNDIMGEQARQISYTLSLASKPAMVAGQTEALHRIGQDLLTSRNILFVAFLDAHGKPLTFASRDPNFQWAHLKGLQRNTQSLMQVRREDSPLFGDHLEIVAPVLSVTSSWTLHADDPDFRPESLSIPFPVPDGDATQKDAAGPRLLGYVSVGLSQAREIEQLRQVNYSVVAIGCLLLTLCLPLAYTLVHRVFYPIRQLVEATVKIADGDLATQVAIHRPDVIGVLARSFNQMVHRVRQQQEQLAQANDRLADANRDLERKVHQRTGQLEMANQRLSNEIAEKEDFLRAVSHDLNAPLRNISGMASMLLMKHRNGFDPDVIHRLERIQKNVEVETDLISELLELSRLKTRRQKMEMVEVEAMVRELGDVLENDLRTGGITLSIDTPLPVLNCERARVRQVFQNLIDNAIKYMGHGAPSPRGPLREIHVGCAIRAAETEFYVRDTGMGIDPEDIGKVFFVFRRGRLGAAQSVAGKGVGLASVKSIVEMYSGTIWVESQVGHGSTFRFTINGKYVPASLSTSPAPPDFMENPAQSAGV